MMAVLCSKLRLSRIPNKLVVMKALPVCYGNARAILLPRFPKKAVIVSIERRTVCTSTSGGSLFQARLLTNSEQTRCHDKHCPSAMVRSRHSFAALPQESGNCLD
jgi:hypothetical protein